MNIVGKMGLVPRGIYDSTVSYDFLDFVYYDRATYVAKKLTVGNTPVENNEYWQILAKGIGEGDYVTSTDYATTEKTGIVKPDGTTITVSEDGTISGSNQTVVDSELNGTSENPVQNKVVTAAFNGKADKSMIVNGTTTTEEGFIADARQLNKAVEGSYAAGVAEKISGINANLLKKLPSQFNIRTGSFDNITTPGMYTVDMHSVGNPPENNGWSTVLVWNLDLLPQYTFQMAVSIDTEKIHMRSCANGAWGAWHLFAPNTLEYKNFFGNISANEDIELYAQGVAIKNSADQKLDLHIQARVVNDGDKTVNGSSFKFIDLAKIKSMIGVSNIAFNEKQATTHISFKQNSLPSNSDAIEGYVGVGIAQLGNDYCQLVRTYQASGAVGAWPMDTIRSYLKKGIVYHFDIYGANYS